MKNCWSHTSIIDFGEENNNTSNNNNEDGDDHLLIYALKSVENPMTIDEYINFEDLNECQNLIVDVVVEDSEDRGDEKIIEKISHLDAVNS